MTASAEHIAACEHTIANLRAALTEAVFACHVYGKKPPFTVPYHIDGDLWHFTKVSSSAKAMRTIRDAVERAAVSDLLPPGTPPGPPGLQTNKIEPDSGPFRAPFSVKPLYRRGLSRSVGPSRRSSSR